MSGSAWAAVSRSASATRQRRRSSFARSYPIRRGYRRARPPEPFRRRVQDANCPHALRARGSPSARPAGGRGDGSGAGRRLSVGGGSAGDEVQQDWGMTFLDFTDQVVLVTGASSGIGAAAAVGFAETGATVALHYHHNEDGCPSTRSTRSNTRRRDRFDPPGRPGGSGVRRSARRRGARQARADRRTGEQRRRPGQALAGRRRTGRGVPPDHGREPDLGLRDEPADRAGVPRAAAAARSSTSPRSPAGTAGAAARSSTRPARARSARLPAVWRKSWPPRTSASTRSPRASSTRRSTSATHGDEQMKAMRRAPSRWAAPAPRTNASAQSSSSPHPR